MIIDKIFICSFSKETIIYYNSWANLKLVISNKIKGLKGNYINKGYEIASFNTSDFS